MLLNDTIIAVSSPPNGGGVRAIVRLSGPGAWRLARRVVNLPEELRAGWYGPLAMPVLHPSAELASVLLFQGPRSFTGQDVAEIQLPDSPAVVRACMDELLRQGKGDARPAGAGEFSARAFFNGKIDLTQGEGIAATIQAANDAQLRAAAGLRNGDLHAWIAATAEKLAGLLASLEAGIDFTEEEDVRFISSPHLADALAQLDERVHDALAQSIRIDRLDALPTVAFIGEPNVGKSSLINALAGQERSIVSPQAGTTRDILSAIMHTPAGDIRLLDVPGEEISTDELRRNMMEMRAHALLDADLVIRVTAAPDQARVAMAESVDFAARAIHVQNKADLLSAAAPAGEGGGESPELFREPPEFQRVSAKTGYHIPELRAAIGRYLRSAETAGVQRLVLNHRHRAILQEVKALLSEAAGQAAQDAAEKYPELIAADLRRALDRLGQITGTISPDEILGRIFSTFCIGK